MSAGNRVVSRLLRSPLHPALSGSMAIVRYTGRGSGRQFSTPVQYVQRGDEALILVGRPDTKTWWRNFQNGHGHEIDLLMRGQWLAMTGRAVVGADEPDIIRPLLDTYLERFPRASRALDRNNGASRRGAVVVICTRR